MNFSRLTVAWIGYLAASVFAIVAISGISAEFERAKWAVVFLACGGAVVLWYASKLETK